MNKNLGSFTHSIRSALFQLSKSKLTWLVFDHLVQETYIEIQTEHLPQLLLRMVAALTSHLQALGLTELTYCLRLCSKILSKVQPPLVSPLTLASGPRPQGLSSSMSNPSNHAGDKNGDKADKQVCKIMFCIL